MELSLSIKIALQMVAVIISVILLVYFLIKAKRSSLFYSYIICQGITLLWSIAQIFETLSINKESKLFFVTIEYIPICFIGLSWIIFCLIYAEIKVSYKQLILLCAFPILSYILFVTNKKHNLFFTFFDYDKREYGILFWIVISMIYFYLVGGVFILGLYSFKKFRNIKKQAILLITALMIPFVVNFLYIKKIITPGIDLTPSCFSISLLIISIAIFKYKFLNILPITYRKINNILKEAIIVSDENNEILDFNARVFSLFPFFKGQTFKKTFNDFFSELRKESYFEKEVENKIIFGNCQIENYQFCINGNKQWLSLDSKIIRNKNNQIIAKVLYISDITDNKKLLNDIEEKNMELKAANDNLIDINDELNAMNKQLRYYSDTIEELSIAKERNRISRDIHDTLGHTLTLIIALLEAGKISYDNNCTEAKEKIDEAVKIARSGIRELRRSINGFIPQNLESQNLNFALQSLFQDFDNSKTKIEFIMDGTINLRNPIYSDVIYRVCQEAITNSIRHGNATNINIILRFISKMIKLSIIDNGIGCKEINKGFGIKGMEERLKSINGKIVFGSDGESGFNINIEIPLEVEDDKASIG